MAKSPKTTTNDEEDEQSSDTTDSIVAAAHPEPPAPEAPVTRRVVVAAGRHIVHQVQVGTKFANGREVPNMVNRTAGPGEFVEMSVADAHVAETHGFLHRSQSGVIPPAPGPQRDVPPTTINGDDGQTLRPR